MPTDTWTAKIAFYAACQYRLGSIIDAGFTASVLFEKYIADELEKCQLVKSSTGDFLFNAIAQLSESNNRKYNFTTLDTLRKIRNRTVVHNSKAFADIGNEACRIQHGNDIKQLVEFVWRTLDVKNYRKYRNLDSIPQIHADFAVLGVKDFFEPKKHQVKTSDFAIHPEDFNDLLHMRQHFLQLSEYLQHGLLKKYPNLEVDLISHVDTSSGYVWLAINHKRPTVDHQRDRIRHSSASIFATPKDLRISIDFGGEDFLGRYDYYQFLETEELRDFIATNDQLSCIDLEWYSFITECRAATAAFVDPEFPEKLKAARYRLNSFNEEGRIVTFERMLLGYVFGREKIEYSTIAGRLVTIIELYYRLERFRRDLLSRNNQLMWVPEEL